MSRIDVGGNRAGTQTGYTAYGQTGQVRVLIEGINTTEGTDGAGFYFDYASLEEAFLGTSGQSAEMPNPGVQSQFIAQSGGNQFSGEYHLDWYNNSLQGSNMPDEYIVPTAFNNSADPRAQQRDSIATTTTTSTSAARSRRTRSGSSAPTASSSTRSRSRTSRSTRPSTPCCGTRSARSTYQVNQKNKLIGYYQWGQKDSAEPPAGFATYTYTSPDQTFEQDSGSWVYKGEWNGTVSDKLYLEARYGDFGYYFPLITNSARQLLLARHRPLRLEGAHQKQQLDRDRKQYNLASTYFLDTGKGSHTFKIGARAAEGAVVGRLRVTPRRRQQHRTALQQRRVDAGDLRHPDRDVRGRQPGRARLPDVAQRRSIRSARSSTTRGRSAS